MYYISCVLKRTVLRHARKPLLSHATHEQCMILLLTWLTFCVGFCWDKTLEQDTQHSLLYLELTDWVPKHNISCALSLRLCADFICGRSLRGDKSLSFYCTLEWSFDDLAKYGLLCGQFNIYFISDQDRNVKLTWISWIYSYTQITHSLFKLQFRSDFHASIFNINCRVYSLQFHYNFHAIFMHQFSISVAKSITFLPVGL